LKAVILAVILPIFYRDLNTSLAIRHLIIVRLVTWCGLKITQGGYNYQSIWTESIIYGRNVCFVTLFKFLALPCIIVFDGNLIYLVYFMFMDECIVLM